MSKLVRPGLINRILIIGLGSIGKRHLRLARELVPNADIRVLRHQATNEVPECSNGCFSSIEDAIIFEPQIAVIANPAPFHIITAKKLAIATLNASVTQEFSDWEILSYDSSFEPEIRDKMLIIPLPDGTVEFITREVTSGEDFSKGIEEIIEGTRQAPGRKIAFVQIVQADVYSLPGDLLPERDLKKF